MLLGKTYYYRKDFDSAALVFKYINYAYAQKDKDHYDIPIGSNESNNNGVFTIATKENRSFLKKMTSVPPSRNEALLWEAKNYIDAGELYHASGILEILRSDPNFPGRLQTDLHEALAYWCYKQQFYDSAALHLSMALENADNKLEKARWEFLIAQMYQIAGMNEQAATFYSKSATHTTDPIMEVYANLSSITTFSGDTINMMQQKLNNLLKMARRDKYVSNRDIIYYAISQVELEMNNRKEAEKMLQKSVLFSVNNPEQKSKSFLLLADMNYDDGQYRQSKNFYDSIEVNFLETDDQKRVNERLPALTIISGNFAIIHTEDSLQLVAKMPEAERDALIKKTVKQLRKAEGLKEDDNSSLSLNPAINRQLQTDLLTSKAKGSDWYFNNLSLKTTGANAFKAAWGRRPNVDDWRRQAAINDAAAKGNGQDINSTIQNLNDANDKNNNSGQPSEISFDALLKNLPLTEKQLKASNEKISDAYFSNGQTFQNKLEDYSSAIYAYDTLNIRFPDNTHIDEALFNMVYCYTKSGKKFSADSARTVLNKKFKDSKWDSLIRNPSLNTGAGTNIVTKKYEAIYNLFIEGKFEEAKSAKANADSIYSNTYWTPQLIFIESIYYVSKKEDSIAIRKLNELAGLYPSSPMTERAKTMIDVLNRRKEIENYLTALQISRYKDDEPAPVVNLNPVEASVNKKTIKRDSVVSNPLTQAANAKVDTAKAKLLTVKKYVFNAGEPQFVVILLDKVDPVYANEARNAFSRYNSSNFYNQKLNVSSAKLDDQYNLVLIGPFSDAVGALNYMDKTKPVANSRILPWLKAEKFSYTIISQANLDLLTETKDLEGYSKLLQQAMPGKF